MVLPKLLAGSQAQRTAAFANIFKCISFSRHLPEQVFEGHWSSFEFFESDRLFCGEFVVAASKLLSLSGASVACLLNIDKFERCNEEHGTTLYIDEQTDRDAFSAALVEGGPAEGWLYGVDRYACTPDNGSWCVYCEKGNDISVIGFQEEAVPPGFREALDQLVAKSIDDLVGDDAYPLFPFDRLVPDWRAGLLINYSGNQRWRVIAAAESLSGDRVKAIKWLDRPLASFSGKTPLQLIEEGRADDVIGYLQSFESGFVG